MGQAKTGLFDTHPSDRDRIARARAETDDGIFHLDGPATGLFRNFERTAAARYSFLLSVPAVVLSGLFELRHVGEGGGPGAAATLVATLVAFVVGYTSIAFLLRYLARHTIEVFVVYRVVLGVLVVGLAASGAIS